MVTLFWRVERGIVKEGEKSNLEWISRKDRLSERGAEVLAVTGGEGTC